VWYRDHHRWRTFLDRLDAAPGIVVTKVEKVDGRRVVRGMRDPLAEDPMAIAGRSAVDPERVAFEWEPFTSLEEGLVLRRATAVLEPPEGVALGLAHGTLSATGDAPAGWLRGAEERALKVPGVEAFRHVGETAGPGPVLVELARRAESRTMRFPSLSAELLAADVAVVEALAIDIRELVESATAEGWTTQITLVGHADSTGREELNIDLSRRRAEAVSTALGELGIPSAIITALGVGSSQPVTAEQPGAGQDANRRVDVTIEFEATRREAG
jgi:OOP family OmpA-OmpF porin